VMYKLCDLSESYCGLHVATELYKGLMNKFTNSFL
jgi:hypothetical protein